MKVLIIDDEMGILKMYEAYLKTANIEVVAANSGEEGLKLATDVKPDVILLDIIMPKMNGLDVLQKLKEQETTKNIPVYLLTNLPADCSGDKATALGAAGYLVKAENEPKMVIDIIRGVKK